MPEAYEKYLLDNSLVEREVKVGEDVIKVSVRRLPWSLKNKFTSQAMSVKDDGSTTFDGDYYMRECLKYVIAKAPWGDTTDVFLTKIDSYLGKALESLIPSAFESTTGQETTKKESSDS